MLVAAESGLPDCIVDKWLFIGGAAEIAICFAIAVCCAVHRSFAADVSCDADVY